MTTAVLLAVTASVAYGLSDVLSGVVVRRHATAALALWAQLTGLVVLGVAVAVLRPPVDLPGLAWAAAAGAVGALGVLAFYGALQRGRTSVVATLAGTGVVVPVLVGAVGEQPLGPRGGLGIAVVVAGVLLVAAGEEGPDAATPGRTQPVPVPDGCVAVGGTTPGGAAAALALAAAACFGTFFVLLEVATDRASPVGGDGLEPSLVVALTVTVGALSVTLLAAARHTRACLRPGRELLLPATAVGLLDVTADVLVTLAVDRGPLAVVGPLASLDPVVAALVAVVVLRERIRPVPAGGVVLALAGTALLATG